MILGDNHRNDEYLRWLPRWQKVDALVSGDIKLPDIWIKYLPVPYIGKDPQDKVIQEKKCNYIRNARLLNVASRTLSIMSGMVSADDNPNTIEVPAGSEYLLTNADGSGMGLMELMNQSVTQLGEFGRQGLFVDSGTSESSVADMQNGLAGARILPYKAENILDWSYRMMGSVKILDKVILLETWRSDEGSAYDSVQVRELTLDDDGFYQITVKRWEGRDTSKDYHGIESYKPTINGARISRIPFYFLGSLYNTAEIDTPPIESLVDLNIGHLLNSAEVEEAAFYLAPTGFISLGNMSVESYHKANPCGITLGAADVGVLGDGGSFSYIQPSPSNLAREVMADKERQMASIGGQLINIYSAETAEAARIQKKGEVANVVTIVENAQKGYTAAVATALEFNGQSGAEFMIDLGKDFAKGEIISDQALQILVNGVATGSVTQELVDNAIKQRFPSLDNSDGIQGAQ